MQANLELYKIFDCVARTESFSKAAKALFITQPAVSQAIKQLETALDTVLFSRTAKGVTLTAEGQVLHSYVSSGLSFVASGEERLSQMRYLETGDLRIGAGDATTKHFLLPYINRFHKQHPALSINVTNRTTPDLLEMVRNGAVDLAFVNLPVDPKGLEVFPCLEIEDLFVAGPGFNHLQGQAVSYRHLASHPLIMLEQAANSRQYVDRRFLERGVTLTPEIELGSYDLLLDFAEIGLGIACVIREFANERLQNGRLFEIKLESPLKKRAIGVCHLKSIALSTAAAAFIDTVTNGIS